MKPRLRLPSLLSPGPNRPPGGRFASLSSSARLLRPDVIPQDAHRERAARLAESGDPEKYIRRVFGWKLARDQKRAVAAYLESRELLLVGANGTGKSILAFMLAFGWSWDAEGSRLQNNGSFVGGILLLIAPKGEAIKEAYQKHILTLGRMARDNGHLMPGWGQQSKKSASWVAIEGHWYIKGMTASKEAAGQDEVAHSVLGPHHENFIIVYDEIKAIAPSIVEAGKGRLVSGPMNKAIASTNPTSATGLGHKLSVIDGWKTIYSSAVGRLGYTAAEGEGSGGVEELKAHENVFARRPVFPGAVSHVSVEADLRTSSLFENRGQLWTGTGDPPEGYARPSATQGDFIYALPSAELEDVSQGRSDGFPGHPGVELQVLRPLTGVAYGRIVGGWPPMDPHSLFSEAGLLAAVQLRSTLPAPKGPPRVIGVDASTSERGDEMVAVPWWGPPARELIQLAWGARPSEGASIQAGADVLTAALLSSKVDKPPGTRGRQDSKVGSGKEGSQNARASGPHERSPTVLEAIAGLAGVPASATQDMRAHPGVPAYIGEPLPLPVAEAGAAAARILIDKWGKDPVYHLDPAHGAGIGSSLKAQYCKVRYMYFGGRAALPLPGQTRAAHNARATWAFDLADAVGLGLVGMCRDPQARADLVALGAPEEVDRAAVKVVGAGGRVTYFKVREKPAIKKYLGRSPDRGDGVKLASASMALPKWE